MSAYLVAPEHIGALAAFVARKDKSGYGAYVVSSWATGNSLETARNVAHQLALENIRSVSIRYPNDGDGERPGVEMLDADFCKAAADYAQRYYFEPPPLKPLDIYKMCGCYAYQSCESDNWQQTQAHEQIEAIKNEAISRLPGYDTAVRDYYHQPAQKTA